MKKIKVGEGILLSLSVILIYAILKKPDIAIGYMRSGLTLCAQRVIPSLFPFAVLSCLFVDMGGADLLGKYVGGIVSRIFGIGRSSAFVPIAGMLCGFPTGAIAAARLYHRGDIGTKELQRLLVISGIPGSAFLISGVGISMWSSHEFGVSLYVIQIVVTVFIGVILNLLFPLKVTESHNTTAEPRGSALALFCDSIGDCAYSMLRICGFVLFFTSSVGTLCTLLEDAGLSPALKIPVMGIFEMTGAISLAPQLGQIGAVLTAFFVGWAGLSIHFQIFSVCRGIPVSPWPYFVAKAIQGVLSALLAYLYIRFFCLDFTSPVAPAASVSLEVSVFFAGLFVIALLLPILRKKFL